MAAWERPSVGALVQGLALQPVQRALTFVAGIGMQITCTRMLGLRHVAVLSAVVTCFGPSLLLRAGSLWVHPLVAAVAIGPRFCLRARGKPVYNPARLGVAPALGMPCAWVSAGSWGNDLLLAGWFLVSGGIVTQRARRYDVSLAFLAAWALPLAGRAFRLGHPAAVLVHQRSGGALLLFSFFMISDPMTTSHRRGPRIAFTVLAAALAFAWQFVLFRSDALVVALFAATPLVPSLDRCSPGERFVRRPLPGQAGRA